MNQSIYGLVNRILPQSFVDGPGNRSVVFLQGCNFQCLYCHNPYTINMCTACGKCVDQCPVSALSVIDGKINWESDICEDCDRCIIHCPQLSSPKVYLLSPLETWRHIKVNQPFISGITISGGEPTQQPVFLEDFLKIIKQNSTLDTCIETNGCIERNILDSLLPYLDRVMVDLKAFEPTLHQRLTGVDNQQTLRNIQVFAEKSKLHMVRTTVVPGFTDSESNIARTAEFLSGIDRDIHLRLLKFRPHGVYGEAKGWESPSEAVLIKLVEVAQMAGLRHVDFSY
jgi:pyruvate formate lyase activating enzyme